MMITFKYMAKDTNARTITGKISAETQASVLEELRKRKLTVISLSPIQESLLSKISFQSKKVKADDIVIFSRQLATMVDAGIPILQGLEALREQMTQPYFQSVIKAIHDDIQLGSSLFAAFAKHPKVFDSLFVNMIKVGETGGILSTVLDRVSSYMEKSLKLKRKVQSAMIYPLVVVSMAIIITIILLVKVVPTFASIYASFDQELPLMTKMLINLSNIVKTQLLWYIAGGVVAGFIVNRWGRTEKGALAVDRAKLWMPVFGELIRKVAISRFCRTLSTLIQSGVPILESLEIVGKTSGNKVLEAVVDHVKNTVREGESIAVPLVKSGVFPPMVTRMIAIGEKSGQLAKMLNKIAEFYDEQVDAAVAGLTSLIEPLIIGFLGIVVGFIVIALFLPIMSITQFIK